MPVEEIIKELKKQDKIISLAQLEKERLYKQLENAGADEYDWISVKQASRILGVSECLIYQKINSGKLQTKRINTAIRIRKSEILEIDDKVRKCE